MPQPLSQDSYDFRGALVSQIVCEQSRRPGDRDSMIAGASAIALLYNHRAVSDVTRWQKGQADQTHLAFKTVLLDDKIPFQAGPYGQLAQRFVAENCREPLWLACGESLMARQWSWPVTSLTAETVFDLSVLLLQEGPVLQNSALVRQSVQARRPLILDRLSWLRRDYAQVLAEKSVIQPVYEPLGRREAVDKMMTFVKDIARVKDIAHESRVLPESSV